MLHFGTLTQLGEQLPRLAFSLLGAVVSTLLESSVFMLVFFLAVAIDCLSAYRLARRVKRTNPTAGRDAGKLESRKLGKIFHTLLVVSLLIWLCHLVQVYVFRGVDFGLPNFVAGGAIFWQIWSILENESSCNGAPWAKFLQRFLVDKTSRHLGQDLGAMLSHRDDDCKGKEQDKDDKNDPPTTRPSHRHDLPHYHDNRHRQQVDTFTDDPFPDVSRPKDFREAGVD